MPQWVRMWSDWCAVDEDLAECDFGDWDGHTFAEVRDRWPAELATWLGSVEVAPPGGESFAACRSRVLRARSRLVERYPGERVLVVAHVTPIKVLVAEAVGAPLEALYRMELKPCSVSTLAWFPDGNTSMFSFMRSACVVFGMTISPCWMCQRTITCAIDLPFASPIFRIVSSFSTAPDPSDPADTPAAV